MDRVAIIGAGQTKLKAARPDQTFADLIYEATTKALEHAQLKISDIDNIITTSNDFLDGRTISSMAVGDAAGAAFGEGKNTSTVEGDGTFGAFYGLTRILSGSYGTTLVVAHGKQSEGDHHLITNAYLDPIYERSVGLDWLSAGGLQAAAYMARTKTTPEALARVVVLNRAHGVKNPNAQHQTTLSEDQVMSSKQLCPPLRELDLAPLSDGAAAIIFAREDIAEKRCAKPVWVEGVAFSADNGLTRRDLSRATALTDAAKKAMSMAKISDAKREINVIELSEEFSYQEPMWLEAMGLDGVDGDRINPSGGALCGHAPIAAGLVRMIEAAQQLRSGPTGCRALAHGQNGLAGQSHCVWILGN